jgi:D-alanyl-D-alanine carboxypeptidase
MRSLFLVISLLISSTSIGQITSDMEASFELLLETVVSDFDGVGVSAAVRVGNDIWSGTAGISAVEEDLTAEHTFGMGSITKTFTSAVILDMADDGLLDLDDPLSDYVPFIVNVDGGITIRQMLNHTSGLYNFTDHPSFIDAVFENLDQVYTPLEVLTDFVNAPIFLPGTDQIYSNTNYLLLGMIIKSISGNEMYEECAIRFNNANQYPSLSMPPLESDIEEMAHLWMDTTLTGFAPLVDCVENDFILNSFFSAAQSAGAYAITPTDLTQWLTDLYSGSLLSLDAMEQLFDTPPFLLNGAVPYGLGVVQYNMQCGSGWGHSGNIVYTSDGFYVPDYDLSIAVMTNDGSGIQDAPVFAVSNELLCIFEEAATSIDEGFEIEPAVAAFPNPTNGLISIKLTGFDEISNYTITDLTGRIVAEGVSQLNPQFEVDLSQQQIGIYVLRVSDDSRSVSIKIAKE